MAPFAASTQNSFFCRFDRFLLEGFRKAFTGLPRRWSFLDSSCWWAGWGAQQPYVNSGPSGVSRPTAIPDWLGINGKLGIPSGAIGWWHCWGSTQPSGRFQPISIDWKVLVEIYGWLRRVVHLLLVFCSAILEIFLRFFELHEIQSCCDETEWKYESDVM